MKVYFQDFKDEVQDEILEETMEKMRTVYPDYADQAKAALMSVTDWLLERADDWINTHNYGIDVAY